jgi:hypothetical protein
MPAINKKQVGINSRKATTGGRFYQILEGKEYISITNALESISKPALIGWAAKVEKEACIEAAVKLHADWENLIEVSENYKQVLIERIGKQKQSTKLASAAAEIGTATHSLVEWWARKKIGLDVGPRPTVGEKSEWGYMAFEDWAKEHSFKPIRSEMVVYSHVHEIAGTLDLLGYIDGKLQIVDIKTGKAVYDEAKLQCSAYFKCLKEMNHDCENSAIILRLPKVEDDPEFEPVPVTNLDEHFQTFLHAKELRIWQIAMEKEYKAKLESFKS